MKIAARRYPVFAAAFGFLALAVLGGCQVLIRPGPTPTLTTTVTLIPSATPFPTSTDTPYPTWTLVPSLTPTATVTLTPTPTQTATPGWCGAAGPLHTPLPPEDASGRLRLVYLSAGDLWVWDESASTRRVTTAGDIQSVELSGDGRFAAYLRPAQLAGSEIWLLDIDAGEARLLAGQERLRPLVKAEEALGVVPHHLAWVPGRSRLAFNARPVWPEVRDYIPDDLWLLELPSGDLRNALPGGQGGEFTFSPDGLNVAIARPDRLDLYGSSGESPRRNALPGYHGVGLGTEDYFPKPFWSRDSRSLRLAVPAPLTAQSPNPEVDLWELSTLGASRRRLGTIRALPPSVVFSPDLNKAAYINWPDLTPRIKELGLGERSGAELISAVYTAGLDLEFLGWSPDSAHFAFWLPAVLQLRLGSLCVPAEIYDAGPARLGALQWVDAERFIYSGGGSPSVRLFLGRIDGESQEIGPLEGTLDFDYVLGD